ncbi:MAG: hypothetical protein ACI8RH_001198 [Flavobacteriales bacterium]|jgi:hypothetical protein
MDYKKSFYLGLCVLLYSLCSAQKPKLYLGTELQKISEIQYNKIEKESHLLLSYQTDSLEVFVKMKQEITGVLSKKNLKNVRLGYEISTSKKLDALQTIVVQYCPGEDPCNSSGNSSFVEKKYRSSKKQINKTPHHTAYFVYKNTTGLSQSKKGVDWYLDHNQTIENLFFPLHFNCGSFVIIKPNGAYYSYKSEYSNNLLFRVLSSF